jgi:predicted small secreted protein
MKKIAMAATLFTALVISSCNSGAGGDPKSVLIAFFDALSKKDIATAKKLATKESESMFSLMEMGMKMAKDSKNDEMDKFNKDKMVFGDAKIDGDKATIEVKDKEKGEAVNFIMKKESGNWKVAFDKASMMQMGMEKMNEKGMDGAAALDSISSGLDKLKNINVDSLTNTMKEGLEKLNENKDKIEDAAKKLQEAAEKLKQ